MVQSLHFANDIIKVSICFPSVKVEEENAEEADRNYGRRGRTDKQAVYSKQEPEKSEENLVETEDKTDEADKEIVEEEN